MVYYKYLLPFFQANSISSVNYKIAINGGLFKLPSILLSPSVRSTPSATGNRRNEKFNPATCLPALSCHPDRWIHFHGHGGNGYMALLLLCYYQNRWLFFGMCKTVALVTKENVLCHMAKCMWAHFIALCSPVFPSHFFSVLDLWLSLLISIWPKNLVCFSGNLQWWIKQHLFGISRDNLPRYTKIFKSSWPWISILFKSCRINFNCLFCSSSPETIWCIN